MTRTGWQRTWVRIVTTLLTALVMAMIFFFSMENAESSDQRSGFFSRLIMSVLHPEFDGLSAEEQTEVYDRIQHIVRKTAHFSEYLLLGFFLRLCLESWFGNRMKSSILCLLAFAGSVLYACTDEMHQLLIDGRSGQWTDVLVDGSGALVGTLFGLLAVILFRRAAGTEREPVCQ